MSLGGFLESHTNIKEDEWKLEGACRNKPNADRLFFPETKNDPLKAHAKRICREQCPVRAQCLHAALRNNEQGIWGGTDEEERLKIKAMFGADVGYRVEEIKISLTVKPTTEPTLGAKPFSLNVHTSTQFLLK